MTPPGIDAGSFHALVDLYLELNEFMALEKNPGRISWLSEIAGEFEILIERLKPSVTIH